MNEYLIRINELNQLANWAQATLQDLERQKVAHYIVTRIREILNQEEE